MINDLPAVVHLRILLLNPATRSLSHKLLVLIKNKNLSYFFFYWVAEKKIKFSLFRKGFFDDSFKNLEIKLRHPEPHIHLLNNHNIKLKLFILEEKLELIFSKATFIRNFYFILKSFKSQPVFLWPGNKAFQLNQRRTLNYQLQTRI